MLSILCLLNPHFTAAFPNHQSILTKFLILLYARHPRYDCALANSIKGPLTHGERGIVGSQEPIPILPRGTLSLAIVAHRADSPCWFL